MINDFRLPEFYRGVLVYVGFGASGLGLLALVAMSLYSALAKWKRSESASVDVMYVRGHPPVTLNKVFTIYNNVICYI